jgi:hypothetical protein
VQQWILAIAILILPIHLVTDGAGLRKDDAHVASRDAEVGARCAQALGVETACLHEGLLEVSGMADAADVVAQDTAPAGERILRAMAILSSNSFPESIYPQIASPPMRLVSVPRGPGRLRVP